MVFSGLPPSFIDKLVHVLLCDVSAILIYLHINIHQTDTNISGSANKSHIGFMFYYLTYLPDNVQIVMTCSVTNQQYYCLLRPSIGSGI